MFTWICPKCGREVPPAYSECPDCKAKGDAPATTPTAPASEPPAPAVTPPAPSITPAAASITPPAPASQPPPSAAAPVETPVVTQPALGYPMPPPPMALPPHSAGMPTWLLTLLFAFAFLGLGAGIYWGVGYFRNSGKPGPAPTVESPAAKAHVAANPLQKYVEISGIRFVEDGKNRVMVKFTVTNHSDADLSGLAGNVTIWGRTQKSEEDAVGTFSFTTDVSPETSKDVTAPLTTKLKVYELPDWQNITTDLQVTAPK